MNRRQVTDSQVRKVDINNRPRTKHTEPIKRILRVSIAKGDQKIVASDCGVIPSALSHWTSDASDNCLPLDVLPVFIASTGDLSILHYLAEQVGMELRERAS